MPQITGFDRAAMQRPLRLVQPVRRICKFFSCANTETVRIALSTEASAKYNAFGPHAPIFHYHFYLGTPYFRFFSFRKPLLMPDNASSGTPSHFAAAARSVNKATWSGEWSVSMACSLA